MQSTLVDDRQNEESRTIASTDGDNDSPYRCQCSRRGTHDTGSWLVTTKTYPCLSWQFVLGLGTISSPSANVAAEALKNFRGDIWPTATWRISGDPDLFYLLTRWHLSRGANFYLDGAAASKQHSCAVFHLFGSCYFLRPEPTIYLREGAVAGACGLDDVKDCNIVGAGEEQLSLDNLDVATSLSTSQSSVSTSSLPLYTNMDLFPLFVHFDYGAIVYRGTHRLLIRHARRNIYQALVKLQCKVIDGTQYSVCHRNINTDVCSSMGLCRNIPTYLLTGGICQVLSGFPLSGTLLSVAWSVFNQLKRSGPTLLSSDLSHPRSSRTLADLTVSRANISIAFLERTRLSHDKVLGLLAGAANDGGVLRFELHNIKIYGTERRWMQMLII